MTAHKCLVPILFGMVGCATAGGARLRHDGADPEHRSSSLAGRAGLPLAKAPEMACLFPARLIIPAKKLIE